MAPLPGERVGALLAAACVLSDMCVAMRTGGGSVPWNAAGRRGITLPRGQAQRRRGFCSAKGVPERSAWRGASVAGRRSEGTGLAAPCASKGRA